MFDREQYSDLHSRFSPIPTFAIPVIEPEGGDWITPREVAELLQEVGAIDGAAVKSFDAAIGRGASGSGIGLVIDLAVNLSATAIAAAVALVWQRIRHRRPQPTMSVGAARYLCLADLCQRLARDSIDDIVTVVACEASGSPHSELNHVGIEPILVVLADSANTRSWVYLISPQGHVLSFNEGSPMPYMTSLFSGLPQPPDEPPQLLDL